MLIVHFQFSEDHDGPLVTLTVRGAGVGELRDRDLELALLFDQDDPQRDPVVAGCEPDNGAPLFRSAPLSGQVFLDLREIWRRRAGEGIRLELAGVGDAAVSSWALDFEGNLARGRIHEAAGRLEEARECYAKSASPTRDRELRRVGRQPAPAGPSEAPEGAGEAFDGELVILHILRAIAADGKVDAREMRTLKALGPAFAVRSHRVKELIDRVREEGAPPGGAMVPGKVLQELLHRAARDGRIGPESSRLLNRAAQVLGLSLEEVRAVLARS